MEIDQLVEFVPMKSVWLTGAVLTAWMGVAHATDLNVRVRASNGSPTVVVSPGSTVPYGIVGELSDNASGGLAMFALDLSFSGGPLLPASTPTLAPMNRFASPLGFTNPAGYGGTRSAGALLQIGGAQNTIRNTIAAVPNGSVLVDVAQLGSPVTLAGGSLTAPYQVGTFTLSASNVQANVLRAGQSGLPFWTVDPANSGIPSSLQVTVQAMRLSQPVVSATSGQRVTMTIAAGPANAGRMYVVLGSTHGTSPGLTLPGGMVLPVAPDRYTQYTQHFPNSPILSNSFGTLDVNGRATVTFHPNGRFAGQTVHHAFYLLGPIDFVSEAESINVQP